VPGGGRLHFATQGSVLGFLVATRAQFDVLGSMRQLQPPDIGRAAPTRNGAEHEPRETIRPDPRGAFDLCGGLAEGRLSARVSPPCKMARQLLPICLEGRCGPMTDAWKVVRRVVVAFGGIFVIVIVLSAVVLGGLRDATRLSSSMVATDTRILRTTERAQLAILNLRRYEKDFFLNIGAPDVQASYLADWQRAHQSLVSEMGALQSLSDNPAEWNQGNRMSQDVALYAAAFQDVTEAVRTGRLHTPQEANMALSSVKNAVDRVEKGVDERSADGLLDTLNNEARVSQLLRRVARACLIAALATMLFVLLVAGMLIRSIYRSHKQLERQHKQMLGQEKLSGLGLLAAGMAHEINNPMSYVTANVKALLKDLDALATNPRLRLEYGESVLPETLDGIKRVNSIVADVQRFARGNSEEVDGFVTFNVNDEVQVALRLARHELMKHCRVVVELGELPAMEGWPQQITQVLVNLLVNAAQAVTTNGLVKVTTWAEGPEIVVTVSDNGSGMSAATLAQLFQPFFTTKPFGQGTGLGLAVVHGIVTAHRGRVEVKSEPGTGTAFTIRLPTVRVLAESVVPPLSVVRGIKTATA
jgi:signal transduction histidine kinase